MTLAGINVFSTALSADWIKPGEEMHLFFSDMDQAGGLISKWPVKRLYRTLNGRQK